MACSCHTGAFIRAGPLCELPAAGATAVRGLGTAAGNDALVLRYQDAGGSATASWAQVGGSSSADEAVGLALSGQSVYVAAGVQLPASFGSLPLAGTSPDAVPALARLTDTTLPTRAARAGAALALYPNPGRGATLLTGAAPGQPAHGGGRG